MHVPVKTPNSFPFNNITILDGIGNNISDDSTSIEIAADNQEFWLIKDEIKTVTST